MTTYIDSQETYWSLFWYDSTPNQFSQTIPYALLCIEKRNFLILDDISLYRPREIGSRRTTIRIVHTIQE